MGQGACPFSQVCGARLWRKPEGAPWGGRLGAATDPQAGGKGRSPSRTAGWGEGGDFLSSRVIS